MSMQPSDFTVAVRQLVSVYPNITHDQARPFLEELGVEVVPHPGRISSEASSIKEYDVSTLKDVKAALEAVGTDLEEHPRLASKVYKEYQQRDAFGKEANQFNVSKSNFKKQKGASDLPALPASVLAKVKEIAGDEFVEPSKAKKRGGRKPKAATSTPAPAPAKKRRGRKAKTTAPEVNGIESLTKMLALVQKCGGVKGASERVAELEAEIAELQSAIRVAEAAEAAVKAA